MTTFIDVSKTETPTSWCSLNFITSALPKPLSADISDSQGSVQNNFCSTLPFMMASNFFWGKCGALYNNRKAVTSSIHCQELQRHLLKATTMSYPIKSVTHLIRQSLNMEIELLCKLLLWPKVVLSGLHTGKCINAIFRGKKCDNVKYWG